MEQGLDKLQVIADYSMDQLAHDQTGHGSDHTKRVVKLAEKIRGDGTAGRPLCDACSSLPT